MDPNPEPAPSLPPPTANTDGNHAENDVTIRDEDVFGTSWAWFVLICALVSFGCGFLGCGTRVACNRIREKEHKAKYGGGAAGKMSA